MPVVFCSISLGKEKSELKFPWDDVLGDIFIGNPPQEETNG